MKRYVLRYRGTGKPPDVDVHRIYSTPGLSVVDASSPHMFLVEATDEAAQQLKEMPAWIVCPETFVPVPDPRKKVHQPSWSRHTDE
jgi:hypothetical protein